ncbi:response regulator [Fimbriiglobus ruber]|uniref:histidine kinase n=1 Tax=Fimbriiglobus ruber TaxID=1908690 RepID=A0A225D3E4_9BACT|nr:response regulator [Fimbriiglobus ruber]OWK35483.1 sensory box histidine kinase/response regulator [Fimbriiglobus ruber]
MTTAYLPTGPTAATLLVVEDDPGIAELERRRLEEAGYLVIVASNAEDALLEVGRGGIDLVLLDYRLPGGTDGLDFYTRVKQAGYDLPVILVTGFSNEATVIQALRIGVRDVVTKSFEYLDYLPQAVARILRQVGTERRLAESEARLAGVIESAKDAVIVVEADRRVSLFNPAAERMFGCSAGSALGRPLTDFIPNELVPRTGPGESPDPMSLSYQMRMGSRGIRAGNVEFPLEATASRGQVDGRTFHTVVVRDVTDRLRAEEALRLRDRAIQAANQGILIADAGVPDNPIIYASPGFERMTGYAVADVLGRNCRFLQGADTDPAEVARLRAAIRNADACTVELINYRKDGTRFWNELSVSPVRDADGRLTHFVGVQSDVTKRRELEEQFRQAQKMEAVGQLAGGIAHDFNNLLTVISGYSKLLLDASIPDVAWRESVSEIYHAGCRAADLTRQLLAFSRQTVLEPKVLDPNALVVSAEKLLRRLIGEDVILTTRLDPRAGRVLADPGQLEQALVNLAVNARDAMPQGGELSIGTRNVNVDGDRPEVVPGWYVAISATDTGHGMATATRARIFEPFFTTKEPGKGTGLGLPMVYGFVRQSGGFIEVTSEPGLGAKFELFLPRVEAVAVPAQTPGLLSTPTGSETLLLVEDDLAVRSFASRILRGVGYTVLEASDGPDAVRVASAHQGPIALVITDVVMPGGMGGQQVAEIVHATFPTAKVLFVSGYLDDAVVRNGVAAERVNFLPKPFTPSALARKVREVLEG